MKKYTLLFILLFLFNSCAIPEKDTIKKNDKLIGTWKMVYGEIREHDSLQIKDLTKSDFIKIINEDHFAFINQPYDTTGAFYAGGGHYELTGDQYVETLTYTGAEAIRGHRFPFTIELKGDTLIQYGLEEVREANIKRHIVEKYIRIN